MKLCLGNWFDCSVPKHEPPRGSGSMTPRKNTCSDHEIESGVGFLSTKLLC